MESKEFKFKEQTVNFEIENKNVMVNATEMAKIFGKKINDFLRLEQTEEFIKECCKDENYYKLLGIKNEVQSGNSRFENEVQTENSRFENEVQYGNSHFETRKKSFLNVVKGGKNSGTWMHRVLAIKFAAWLNPAFELWVYRVIDELLFGSYREDEEASKEIAKIQDKITEKENELKNLPILKEIEELRKSEQTKKRRLEAIKKRRIANFRTIFPEEEMTGKRKPSNEKKTLSDDELDLPGMMVK